MIFEQINVSDDNNFAYLIGDETSKEAVVVDPSFNPAKVLKIAKKHDLKIKYLINTHQHYDHIDGNDYILEHSNAVFKPIKGGDEFKLGKLTFKIIATPGHTDDSVCILVDNKLLTGDTLFVGAIGRTWSKEDAVTQHKSIHKKILTLPDATEIYPGHDYGRKPFSTIGYEKKTNPFL